jgi:hypothetical protein
VAIGRLDEFAKAFKPQRTLLIGDGGRPLERFLAQPVLSM